MAVFTNTFVQDLQGRIETHITDGLVFSADNESNVVSVELYDGTAPATLTGNVAVYAIREDGNTVVFSGTLTDNVASAVLPQSCFVSPGPLAVMIQIVSGDVKTTVLRAVFTVVASSSGAIIDPGHVIPDIADIISMLDDLEEAIADAEAATAYIAPTEASPAESAHAVGEYIIYNGALYKVIAAIAVGGTLTVGTNISAVPNGISGEIFPLDPSLSLSNGAAPANVVGKLKSALTKDKTSVNIFDGTTWEINGYFNDAGTFTSDNGYRTTAPIYLDAGDYMFNVRKASIGSAALKVFIVNSTGETVQSVEQGVDSGYFFDTDQNIVEFTLASACYIRLNMGTPRYGQYFMIVKGSDPTSYPDEFVEYVNTYVLNDSLGLTEEMLSELQFVNDAVDRIDEVVEEKEPINVFDGTVWSTEGYFNDSGTFNASAGYKTTGPVYLKAGSYMYNLKYGTFGTASLKVFVCNSSGTVLSVIQGTDTGEIFGTDQNIITFTLPSDCYIRENMGTTAQASTFMIVKGSDGTTFPETFQQYFEPYTALKDTLGLTEEMNQELADVYAAAEEVGELSDTVASLSEKVDAVIKDRVNLFDGEAYGTDGYITYDGRFTATTNYKTTSAIYLNSGTYLFNIKKGAYGSSALTVVTCSSDGTITGYVTGTDTGSMYDTSFNIIKFTAPSNGYYRMNIGVSADYVDTFMVVAGDSGSDFPTSYKPYTENPYYLNDDIGLTSKMLTQIQTIFPADKLAGKKLTVNGDSLCYGEGYTGGYAKIIGDTYGMTVQNVGVSGGTITAETYSGTSARHWICRTITSMDSDADYAILEGGVNDAALTASISLGTITNDFASTLDDTTYIGALESCCKQLTTRFAGKKIGFIIVHKMSWNYSNMGSDNGNWYWATRHVLDKWGIPYLDLNVACPPFGLVSQSSAPDIYALTQAYTKNADGWHPNEEGYKKYYVPKIVAWMNTL